MHSIQNCGTVAPYVIHLPAKEAQARENPRIPRSLEIHFGTQNPCKTPSERSRKARCLNHPMLPKHARLTKQTIEAHLIRARRIKTSRFLVLYTSIPGLKEAQVSFTVSKKVAPHAVLRNKLRRRGYSAVRPLIPLFSPGVGVLISYLTPDTKVSISDLTAELKKTFVSIGILA